ncbi:hypothetical protein Tco_0182847, partial [Tanacetum coccineum]
EQNFVLGARGQSCHNLTPFVLEERGLKRHFQHTSLVVVVREEQLLEPALNLTVHCCGHEFRVLNGYEQKSFDEERGLNCVVQMSLP